ncbi:MAG: response regulator transcription factor [Campylobacterales bacterium]
MVALIAVIEDEEDLLELLEYHLGKEGYDVIGFKNGENVEKLLSEESVDLMIVDRNLPGMEGSDLLAHLRRQGYQVPAIFLTAKTAEKDRLEGFRKGGDDYLTKPFNMDELLLRVKAMLKRTKAGLSESLQHRDIVVKEQSHQVFVDGREVPLTRLEFNLLCALMRNKQVVLSRDYLLENVWQDEGAFQEKTVNVAIKRLKEKIDPDKTKEYIKTVRGTGYTLC